MPAMIFCLNCGSDLIDVFGWTRTGVAQFRCCTCGCEANVHNFTLGRFPPSAVDEPRIAALVEESAEDIGMLRGTPETKRQLRQRFLTRFGRDIASRPDTPVVEFRAVAAEQPELWIPEWVLQPLTLAARGLLAECLAVMYDGSATNGLLLVEGELPTFEAIATLAHSTTREVVPLLSELTNAGVLVVDVHGVFTCPFVVRRVPRSVAS